ncbi:MAG: hypothetical protein JST46_04865 [Bacteroidetes bacterium]|nr:hypothetical protein [Bacteroidota bacterium]
MWTGRRLVIATQHGKEKMLSPLLEKCWGVITEVPNHLDTDKFGTFTGEVQRIDGALEAARKKCAEALRISHATLALASEGSFGSHPDVPFLPVDEELLLLTDKDSGREYIASEISTDTNFDGRPLASWKEAEDFAAAIGFPSHGLIIRPSTDNFTFLEKGITDWRLFRAAFDSCLKSSGSVYAETDMRACFNPTRMKVIEAAGRKLIELVNSRCPICSAPGFGVSRTITGLPCRLCHLPTASIRSLEYSCQECGNRSVVPRPDRKEFEEPMYCVHCNP